MEDVALSVYPGLIVSRLSRNWIKEALAIHTVVAANPGITNRGAFAGMKGFAAWKMWRGWYIRDL